MAVAPEVLKGRGQSSRDIARVHASVPISPDTASGTTNGRPPGYLSEGDRIVLERYSKPAEVVFEGPLDINGKPPGYLSPGDRTVLERYSGRLKEPSMGIHDRSTCPDCKDNGNGK